VTDPTTPLDAPVAPVRPPVRARGRFALVCCLLAAGVGVLLYKGLLSSLDYFDTVDQALDHRAQLGTGDLRLEGLVDAGTIVATSSGTTFAISGADGRRVEVVNVGTPPQLFKAGIPVVVVGHFTTTTSSTFDSNQIMVRHTATYVAAHPDRVRGTDGGVVGGGHPGAATTPPAG
jgi:cytochrome c-type biogenesis protein CcmE